MVSRSRELPFTIWSDPSKIVACDRFFGPGIWTEDSGLVAFPEVYEA